MTKQEIILAKIREACPELKNITEIYTVDEDGRAIELEFGEPRLEHLLRAVGSIGWRVSVSSPSYLNIDHKDIKNAFFTNQYDLTKSVTENLQDNEELTNFLFTLFNQEDL